MRLTVHSHSVADQEQTRKYTKSRVAALLTATQPGSERLDLISVPASSYAQLPCDNLSFTKRFSSHDPSTLLIPDFALAKLYKLVQLPLESVQQLCFNRFNMALPTWGAPVDYEKQQGIDPLAGECADLTS